MKLLERRRRLSKRTRGVSNLEPGDCLSVVLKDGDYGATIVLRERTEGQVLGQPSRAYLIAVLDYKEFEKPIQSTFEARNWLRVTHHAWSGNLDIGWYQVVGSTIKPNRLEFVCKTEPREGDPKDALGYSFLANLGEQVLLQRQWDRKTSPNKAKYVLHCASCGKAFTIGYDSVIQTHGDLVDFIHTRGSTVVDISVSADGQEPPSVVLRAPRLGAEEKREQLRRAEAVFGGVNNGRILSWAWYCLECRSLNHYPTRTKL